MLDSTIPYSLDDLACFDRVVVDGGFSAAARTLGMTRSAVSKAVRRLEDGLAVRLLDRTTRRIRVTEAGAALHDRAQRLLEDARAARDALYDFGAHPAGRLSVSLASSLAVGEVVQALPSFRATYPNVAVDLAMDDHIVDLVGAGVDVAIRVALHGVLADSEFIARRLASGRMQLCASPALLARHPVESFEDLDSLPSVQFDSHLGREVRCIWRLVGPDGQPREVVSRPAIRASSGVVVRQALLEGLGAGLLPGFLARSSLADGSLVELLPHHHGPAYTLFGLYPPGPYVPPKVRVFLDHLAHTLCSDGC